MDENRAKEIVQKTVDEWSRVFTNQVFFSQQEANLFVFEVEFSKPTDTKPITVGTVKCFFTVIDNGDGDHELEFNFENESLQHKVGNTMRNTMYEKWIDKLLENKLKVKSILHLGTEFELTRFVDKKGNQVDPFVPPFDMQKVKNFAREKK